MFTAPTDLMGWFYLAIQVGGVIWALTGLVIAARAPKSAYDIEGKLSKNAWLAICGGSAVCFLLLLPLLWIVGAVAVGVFFADVRPAVAGYGSAGRRGRAR